MTSQISAAERWERALCGGMSPKDIERVFFRGTGRPPKNPEFRKICNFCPIQNFCGEYGIVHKEAGVWGGMTEAERDLLPGTLKYQLTQKAKSEGWYEYRVSIDQLVAQVSLASSSLEDSSMLNLHSQSSLDSTPSGGETKFQFDFEKVATASSVFVFDFDTAS